MSINIFFLGQPGVGKSTLAYGLAYYLNRYLHLSTGFVEESAKGLAWRKHISQMNNQLYVSGLYWENILALQGKCDVIISDSHPLVGGVYCSPLYKEALDLEVLYASIEPYSICIVVEPTQDLDKNFSRDGREQNIEEGMSIWKQIEEHIIPKLNPNTLLKVNRNIELDELITRLKVSGFTTS